METLSVVIITFNEEKNIGRCLESLRGLADEIVVVDSFSTDKTKEICLDFGARFFENPFEGHIQQKNFALSLASGQWILSLDADEALDDVLAHSIRKLKEGAAAEVFTMNRLTNYCGQWIYHSGWYPDRKLRLFRKGHALWGGTNPHDQLIPNVDSRVHHLKGNILHYSYTSIQQHVAQANHFSGINALEYFKKGRKASLLKIIMAPWIRFFRDYFWWRGFLDGYYGLVICRISAHAAFLKYVKIRELWMQHKREVGSPKGPSSSAEPMP